jgi:hypothetical protein
MKPSTQPIKCSPVFNASRTPIRRVLRWGSGPSSMRVAGQFGAFSGFAIGKITNAIVPRPGTD